MSRLFRAQTLFLLALCILFAVFAASQYEVTLEVNSSFTYFSSFEFKFTSTGPINSGLHFELDLDANTEDCNWYTIDELDQVYVWYWVDCYFYAPSGAITAAGSFISGKTCASAEFIPQGPIAAETTIICPRRIVSSDTESPLLTAAHFLPTLSATQTIVNAADVEILPPTPFPSEQLSPEPLKLTFIYDKIRLDDDLTKDFNLLSQLYLEFSGTLPSNAYIPLVFSFWTQPSSQSTPTFPADESLIWTDDEMITELGVIAKTVATGYDWRCGKDIRLYFDAELIYLMTGDEPTTGMGGADGIAYRCSVPMHIWKIFSANLGNTESPFILGDNLHIGVSLDIGEELLTAAVNTNVQFQYWDFSEVIDSQIISPKDSNIATYTQVVKVMTTHASPQFQFTEINLAGMEVSDFIPEIARFTGFVTFVSPDRIPTEEPPAPFVIASDDALSAQSGDKKGVKQLTPKENVKQQRSMRVARESRRQNPNATSRAALGPEKFASTHTVYPKPQSQQKQRILQGDGGEGTEPEPEVDLNKYPFELGNASGGTYAPTTLTQISSPGIFYISIQLAVLTSSITPFGLDYTITNPLTPNQSQTHSIQRLPQLTATKLQYSLLKPTLASWYAQLQFDTLSEGPVADTTATFYNSFAIHYFSNGGEIRAKDQSDSFCEVSLNSIRMANWLPLGSYLTPFEEQPNRITGQIISTHFGNFAAHSNTFYRISGQFSSSDVIGVNCTMVLNPNVKPSLEDMVYVSGIDVADSLNDVITTTSFDVTLPFAHTLKHPSSTTVPTPSRITEPVNEMLSKLVEKYGQEFTSSLNVIEWNHIDTMPMSIMMAVAVHDTMITQTQLTAALQQIIDALKVTTTFMDDVKPEDIYFWDKWTQFRDGIWFPYLAPPGSSNEIPADPSKSPDQQTIPLGDPTTDANSVITPFPGWALNHIEASTTWLEIGFPAYLWNQPGMKALDPSVFYSNILKNAPEIYFWIFELFQTPRPFPACPCKIVEKDDVNNDAQYIPGCFIGVGSTCFSDDQCNAGRCLHNKCVFFDDLGVHYDLEMFKAAYMRDNVQATIQYFATNMSFNAFGGVLSTIVLLTLPLLISTMF